MLESKNFLVKERAAILKTVDVYDIFDADTGQQVAIAEECPPGWVRLARWLITKKLMPTAIEIREHSSLALIATLKKPVALFRPKVEVFDGENRRLGYFRAANGGTIFLDEISEMDLSLQPKLLRVLQESRVMPVGGDQEEEIDVRVIAATNRDLDECVRNGSFRLDLFQRLNVIPIEVPPLRARKEDILPLIMHFVRKHAGHYRGTINSIDPRVVDAIAALDSEGNIRQLENLIRHVLLTKEAGDRIELSDLPRSVISKLLTAPDSTLEQQVAEFLFERVSRDGMSLEDVLDYCERLVLEKALAQTGHNQTRTAALLKTTPRTIFNKIRKHG